MKSPEVIGSSPILSLLIFSRKGEKFMQSKTKDILFKLATVAACGLAYCMRSRIENTSWQSGFNYEPRENWYGLAVKAISKSSMWSSYKTEALQLLLGDAPESYYRSVITIVNSTMWSSDKLEALKKESAKFADFVEL